MAFHLADITLTYQGNCLDNVDENNVYCHLLLEEGGVLEDDAECALCSTNWGMRLHKVVKQTENRYTTTYPCLAECGNIVPHLYKVCPFCHGPKKDHIVKLVTRLATGLVGTNVFEGQVRP